MSEAGDDIRGRLDMREEWIKIQVEIGEPDGPRHSFGLESSEMTGFGFELAQLLRMMEYVLEPPDHLLAELVSGIIDAYDDALLDGPQKALVTQMWKLADEMDVAYHKQRGCAQ